ncbi:MAG TPA: MGMT family protein [Candidatus Nitrosotenuis sp.]|nr:MGMT family protein [Candidatus Nitrosotenuis sp.]
MNDLERQVYKILLKVPKGKVTTYGELAKAVGLKNGQRAIGRIMNKNPYPVIIPCHRVVKSDGKIGGYFFGQDIKTKMLSDEGITIKNGKIENWEKSVFRF